MYNNQEYQYTSITSAATTQVFTGKGMLKAIIVNDAGTGGTVKIIDGTSGTTANIGTINLAATPYIPGDIQYSIYIASGLRLVTSNTPNLTIAWSQA